MTGLHYHVNPPAYNFNSTVTGSLALYAKWICNAEVCCTAGTQFVIKIPFRQLPPSDTVTYRWYRNNEFFSDGVATAGDTHIICTVPPNEAHGINVEFHFEYYLTDDCCDNWTPSPRYRVSFVP